MDDDEEYVKLDHIFDIPVGNHIQSYMEAAGISLETMIDRLGLDERTAKELIYGKLPITEEIAKKIGLATETPAVFWMNLYRDQKKLYDLQK